MSPFALRAILFAKRSKHKNKTRTIRLFTGTLHTFTTDQTDPATQRKLQSRRTNCFDIFKYIESLQQSLARSLIFELSAIKLPTEIVKIVESFLSNVYYWNRRPFFAYQNNPCGSLIRLLSTSYCLPNIHQQSNYY